MLAEIVAPHGPAFRFAVLAAVIVIMPLVSARLRIPGMVGLLAGGMIVGPYVLGWITRADMPSAQPEALTRNALDLVS